MTDYLYSLSLAQQTKGFLLALGMGFLLGILYDIIRIIRISISRGKPAVIICDILFCALACLCTFLFCLTVNEGEIRLYLVLGEVAGFFVYYFSLGAIIFACSEKIIDFIKKLMGSVFGVILFPIKWIFGKLRKLFNKLLKKSRKNGKNLKNKSNFLLKVNKLLLYNLFVKKRNLVDGEETESEEV